MKKTHPHTQTNLLKKTVAITAISSLSIFSGTSFADDISDAISEGLKLYTAGDLTEASNQLTYAAQLIQQQRGGDLQNVLPSPLSGWEADEATVDTGGTMFGAGINVSRYYYKNDAQVNIEMNVDSPAIQGMLGLINNPMFITADGGKLKKVKGQKVIVKNDGGSREATIVIDNRILVTVRADGTDEKTLLAYVEALDFEKIKKS